MNNFFKEKEITLFFFLYNLPLILFFHKINLQQIQIYDLALVFLFHSSIFFVLLPLVVFLGKILKVNKNIFLFASFIIYYLLFYYYNIKNTVLNITNNYIQLGLLLDLFILFFYLIIFILFYKSFKKVKYFYNFKVFTIIFLLLNYSVFIYQIFMTYNIVTEKNYLTNNIQIKNNQGNIYYIIFDGMTSLENAEKNNVINNKEEIEIKLKKLNAVYLKNSVSNYSTTYLSLASIFNLNYPVKENDEKYKNRFNFFPYMLTHSKKKNLLLDVLQQSNKNMFWVGNNWASCDSRRNKYLIKCNQHKNKYLNSLLNFYSISPLKKFINFFNTVSQDVKFISDPGKYLSSIKNKNNFYFIHLMLPHGNLLDNNCKISKNKNKLRNLQSYKTQYTCSVNKIFEILESINKNDNNEKIVIISGDHGWDLSQYKKNKAGPINEKLNIDKKIGLIERSEIFNLIVAPDRCKLQKNISSIRSPINNMRFAMNCMHGLDLPYLDNKHFISFYEASKSYGKVMELK
jgi:hypothetical protein